MRKADAVSGAVRQAQVLVGRHRDIEQRQERLVHRVRPLVRCPAVAFPDNPKRADPAWAAGHPRTVIIRGVVMPGGRVDTATAQLADPSDDRYVTAAMSSIAQMRFVPAEFDGVKIPAPIEIVLPFGPAESEETADNP